MTTIEIVLATLLGFLFVTHIQLLMLFSWYNRVMPKVAAHYKPEYQTIRNTIKHLPTGLKLEFILFLGYDVWCNWTSISLRFVQLPHGLFQTVTERFRKWRELPSKYSNDISKMSMTDWRRYDFAVDICDQRLDIVDPRGDHC